MGGEDQMEGRRFPNYTKLQIWVSNLVERHWDSAGLGGLLFTSGFSYLQT